MTVAVEATATTAVARDLNAAGLRSDEQRERWMILGLCGPSLFVVAVVMMVPVAWLFWLSFVGADGTMSWENYTRLWESKSYARIFRTTFEVAFVTTGVCMLIGYPLAYMVSQLPRRAANLAMMAVLLPFWTSLLVRTYAWLVLLQRIMGFSLAREAARRGAQTALVAGPVALQTPAGVERVDVTSAEEMQTQMMNRAATADVIIMAAAVADFRPKRSAETKLKKRDGVPTIVLEPNPDILAGLAASAPNALRIGFAAETNDLEANAAEKLKSKEAHLIVANDVSRTDIGFDANDNEVVVLSAAAPPERLGRESKTGIATKLWDIFLRELASRADKALAITR